MSMLPSDPNKVAPDAAAPAVEPPPLKETDFLKATPNYASWWRGGMVPYIVLMLVFVASDLLCPMPGQYHHLGLGSAIGALFFVASLLVLRRDLSVLEQAFLVVLGLLTATAQVVSASVICFMGLLFVPLVLFCLPKVTEEPQPCGRTWWSFWLLHRRRGSMFVGGCLPISLSIFIGVALFFAFLSIFASGNPVVRMVWNTMDAWWTSFIEFLHLDWYLWAHVLVWGVGAVLFGFYTFARPHIKPSVKIPTPKVVQDTVTMLPHLPLISLVSINLAFLVATSTDIAFLWFRRVPEGISQTSYLYEGAGSIIFASVLAALILLFLFRSNGSVRRSAAPRVSGYVLALQTLLLAVSVFMRLFFQIDDLGFTFRRVLAGESLMMGVVALVLLVVYMVNDGRFVKHMRIGFCVLVLFFFGFNIEPPTALAGDLNLCYAPSHPHWKFEQDAFLLGRLNPNNNLAFAAHYMVSEENLKRTEWDDFTEVRAIESLTNAARATVKRSQDSWRTWTLRNHIDLPAAEYILKVRKAALETPAE